MKIKMKAAFTFAISFHYAQASDHGVKQPRNPWSDGPEYITQWPIPPGSKFRQMLIFRMRKAPYGGMHIVNGIEPWFMVPLLFIPNLVLIPILSPDLLLN